MNYIEMGTHSTSGFECLFTDFDVKIPLATEFEKWLKKLGALVKQ